MNRVKILDSQAILANKICAIRETFEESGLLLTSPPAHEIKALDINHWRKQVHDDASQFRVMCDKFKILPAVDKLVPFSNWITPVHEKKRYNTVFFLTILDQFKTQVEHDNHLKLVAADGKETVLFDWYEPEKGE
jgi:8-oxo-dGTP pyrophosphatase MutT (NUDIX family)